MLHQNGGSIKMKQISLKKKLRYLISTYALASIIVILFLACFLYKNTIDDSKKSAASYLTSANQLVSGVLQKVSFTNNVLIENPFLINTLQNYSEKNYIEQFNADISINEILNDAWKSNAEIAEIQLFVDGKKFSSGSGSIHNLSFIKDSLWYNQLQGASMLLIEKNPPDNLTNKERTTSFTNISMCSKIQSGGNTLAYMRIDISKEHINSIMSSVLTDTKSEVFLLNSDGEIIVGKTDFFSDKDILKFSDINSAPSVKYLNIKTDTYKYAGFISKPNSYGMRLVELIPKSVILNSYYKSLLVIIIVTLLILLAVSVLSHYIVHIISKKIYSFSAATSAGNANLAPFDELEPLIDVSKNLSDLNHKIKLYNVSFTAGRISPHFLYNALDTIVWNLNELDNEQIAHILSSLSQFYRLLLLSSSFVCKLDKEIQLISRYLDLQKDCFGSQISSSIEIDDELMNLYIPSFILQPLVENSFKHGFSNKIRNLHISIKANVISDNLVIILKDNGCGMDAYTLEKINNFSDFNAEPMSLHEGIHNVYHRINILTGGNCSMKFSSSLTGGTTIKITLPVATDPETYNIKKNL